MAPLRLVLALAFVLAGLSALAPAQVADRPVLLVEIDGPIGPATAGHVTRALDVAAERDARLVVLRIDTPGGLATAMRDMISDIIASPVPVASWVAPDGARAASAGTYILYASHVAAMAPATHLGAATPVSIGGGGLPGAPGEDRQPGDTPDDGDGEEEPPAAPADPASAKAVNDSVAYIRALAEMRGRNADWAERAVREAASLTATAALGQDVIDVVERDLDTLLARVDGMTVEVAGAEVALDTAGATVERVERTTVTQILEILSNPNVALLLVTLGFYGLIFELASPGFGPGIVGAIALVLGLYALNQLPLDYTGLALVGLGLAFMTVEAFSPSFGVFGIGGAIAFAFGAWMLVDTDMPAFQVSPGVIAVTTLVSAGLLGIVLGTVWRAQRGRVRTGDSGMIGQTAIVDDWADGAGHVRCLGERWRATGPADLSPGDAARVEAVDGLTLRLAPAPDSRNSEERP